MKNNWNAAHLLTGIFLLLPFLAFNQASNIETYTATIQKAIADGTYESFRCSETQQQANRPQGTTSRAASCSDTFNAGYGSNCWDDSRTIPDPACAIPPVANPACNGGKYRIPIAITIFECFDWTGNNYIESPEGGFEALLNVDLNNKLVEVQALYANANIEFVEVNRQRVQDCDLYDFYQNADPNTGFNDQMDDLMETADYDYPNAINLYFVGGLNSDHDCCGAMAFSPYPPSRDYMILRYGTAVLGSNLAHELGHYFGLPHTYAESITFPVTDGDGVPTGALDNCDCLTQGDRICDTWPDPSFSHNCNHDGLGDACYITMEGGNFCTFDEVAYADHINSSHPGANPNLLISPNSGHSFSATSSTVLRQNIMSNNFIFGCTTTFSPCQYKKIHDVARSECRSYLCNSSITDYFQTTVINAPNSSRHSICIGDPMPVFQAGKSFSGIDTSYTLSCFDWYLQEQDSKSEAILTNSSTFQVNGQIDISVPGVYNFWIAEANALNDPPCKAKISLTISDNPGAGSLDNNSSAVNACVDNPITVNANGASFNEADMVGWYFSASNPNTTLTSGELIETAINNAVNGTTLDGDKGNVIQSNTGGSLTGLSNLSIDCKSLLSNRTSANDTSYFLTPFIAKGLATQSCSTIGNSISFDWNIAGGTTGGTTVTLGPIDDCNTAGLLLSDYSIQLNINTCDSPGGNIGAKIYFNRGAELTIATPFDFSFNCTTQTITISREEILRLKSDYNPLVDQIRINFINSNFPQPDFNGDLSLSLSAQLNVSYAGNNAKAIWDINNRPTVDTNNMACFWGTPVEINCNCSTSACPTIGSIIGDNMLCVGDNNTTLRVTDVQNIGDANIEFVYFNTPQTDSSLYETIPAGILGTGLQIDNVAYPTTPGTYYVYAKLTTIANDCRPFKELVLVINDLSAAPITTDLTYCEGSTAVSLSAEGTRLLWYTSETGGLGDAVAPIPDIDTAGITTYWVSQTVNNCESPRSSLTVLTNKLPVAPIVENVALCRGDSNTALIEGIPNITWYVNETIAQGTMETPIFDRTTVGSTTFWITQTINGCESKRSPITIRINETPTPPEVRPVNYCLDATASPLTAIGENLLWYTSSEDTTGDPAAPTPSTDDAGIINYFVSQTVNTCESSRAILSARIDALPAAPIISNSTYCQGATANALLAGDSLHWYNTSEGGNSFDVILPTTDTIGTQTYWVSTISNGCESERTAVSITIEAIPPPPITRDTQYCQGSSAQGLTAIGDSLIWHDQATDGNNFEIIIPATNTVGTQSYWVSQVVNACESERVPLNVSIQPSINITIQESSNPSTCSGGDGQILLTGLNNDAIYEVHYTLSNQNQVVTLVSDNMGGLRLSNLKAGLYENIYVRQALCTSNILSQTLSDPGGSLSSDLSIIEGNSIFCTGTSVSIAANISGGQSPYILVYNDGNKDTSLLNYISGTPIPVSPTRTTTYTISSITDASNCTGAANSGAITLTLARNPVPPTTSAIRYCQGSPAEMLTATGESLIWYEQAEGGPAFSSILPRTDSIGTQTYWVSQVISECESERTPLILTILPSPATPTVPSSTFCMGETANEIAEGIENIVWYTSQTGGVGNPSAPDINTSLLGTTRYWISQTNGVCESERNFVDVTVYPTPVSPVVHPFTYCLNEMADSLRAEGSNLTWFTSSTSDAGSAIPPVPSTSTAGTQQFWVSQTINGCQSPHALLEGSVVDKPTPPMTTSLNYCKGDMMDRLTAIGTGLIWYDSLFGGTSFETILPKDSIGTQTYWVSQTIDGCESDRTSLSVQINGLPASPVISTNNYNYTVGDIATALTAEGNQLLWYTNIQENGTTVAPTPSTQENGSQQFWVSQTVNGCESELALITVTVEAKIELVLGSLTNPSNGNNGSIELTGLLANTEYTLSYEVNGSTESTSITTNASGSYVIDNLSAGSYTNITIALDGQVSNSLSVELSIDVCNLAATITGTPSICRGTDAAIMVTIQNGIAPYRLVLTDGSNEFIYPDYKNGVPISFSPLMTTSYTITSLEDGQGCSLIGDDNSGQFTINVSTQPPPPTTTDLTFCMGEIASPLTAQGENLRWYISPDGINSPANPPTPTTDLSGRYHFWVSQTINGCESEYAQLSITINPVVRPPVVQDVRYYEGNTLPSLHAEGSNLKWYTTETGGTSSTIAPIPSNTSGTQQFWVSQTINGCESDYARINVTITPTHSPSVQDVSYCEGSTASPLSAQGNNLRWYTAASGGTASTTAPTPSTAAPGTQQFWVSQTINGCESDYARINVTIISTRSPNVQDVSYCEGSTASPLSARGNNLRWYTAASGGTASTTAPTPSTTAPGLQQFWVSQTRNACESDRVLIAVTITPSPKPAIGIVIPPSTCLKNGSIQLTNLHPNETYQLSYIKAGQMIAPYPIKATSNGTYILSELDAGTYSQIRVQLGACISTGLTQTIGTYTPLTATLIGPSSICEGSHANLNILLEGGIPPFRIVLTDGWKEYTLSDYQNGAAITVLPLGNSTYSLVSISDKVDCIGTWINDPLEITVENCNTPPSFTEENNGAAYGHSTIPPTTTANSIGEAPTAKQNNNSNQSIPTMSEWGLLIFALLLLNLGVYFVYLKEEIGSY